MSVVLRHLVCGTLCGNGVRRQKAHAMGAADLHASSSQQSNAPRSLSQPGNRHPHPPTSLRDAAVRRRGISSPRTHTKNGF